MHRHSELAFYRQDPGDASAAADPHIFRQRDFSGHHESEFHRVPFGELEIGVEECSAPAQVLGETAALAVGTGQAHGNRKLKVKAL